LTPADIEDVVALSEPFLQQNSAGVGLFHPDFARWILAGSVPGASEDAGHLAVARGFTTFGRAMSWSDVTIDAARRVIDHCGAPRDRRVPGRLAWNQAGRAAARP
jgi:hypothetical protein